MARLLITALIALGCFVLPAGFAAAAPGTATPVASGYAHPEWLAEPDWLQAHLSDGGVKVVALTPAKDFGAGHIPGAAQIDWPDLQIVETSDQSVKTWDSAVEGKLTAIGLAPGDTVVVYDGGTVYAPRLWWVLRQLGQKDVRILNGGLAAWTSAGGKTETGPSTVKPAASPYIGTPDASAISTLAETAAAVGTSGVVFVDARTSKEYAAGHIPGAVNIAFTLNTAANPPKRWKSADELRAMYAVVGVTPDKHVIAYCSTGVRSAATYFTLALIGYPDVSLFTGSWVEWSSHPELPVATAELSHLIEPPGRARDRYRPSLPAGGSL
jgi:thiosulfate/3-mercaptopyruvate sulfurtransferase